jgi:hypothetical protein
MVSYKAYTDLIDGIPKGYVINAGVDSEGLDFFIVRGVDRFGKYNWIGSCWIRFKNDYIHVINRQWRLEDMSYDTETGELLMGFIFAPRKDDSNSRVDDGD